MRKGVRITLMTLNFIIIIAVSIWLGWYLSEKTNERRGVVTDEEVQAYQISAEKLS